MAFMLATMLATVVLTSKPAPLVADPKLIPTTPMVCPEGGGAGLGPFLWGMGLERSQASWLIFVAGSGRAYPRGIPQGLKPDLLLVLRDPRLKPWGT